MSTERSNVRFSSGGIECAAWYYPTRNGACIVMAGGFGVTKEPATDRFAARFHQAGYGVLAFDHRRIGQSDGRPRQVTSVGDQLADWQAAIRHAATLPGVDPNRIVVWGFSTAGGHVFRIAARIPHVAAAIAQTPNVDGLAAARNASRFQRPGAMLRLFGRGFADALGGLLGRSPRLVPLAGAPGTVALLTTPDGQDGNRALNPGSRYPEWQQAVAARSILGVGFYRPGRDASRVRCPLLVVVADDDQSALAAPAVRAAQHAPHAEVAHLAGGHYAPFLEAHEQTVAVELSFLDRHVGGAKTLAAQAHPQGAEADRPVA